MKAFRACQRLHQYEYTLGYRPLMPSEALRLGTLIHLGLEKWWIAVGQGLPFEERLNVALGAMQSTEEYELARARAMIVGYAHRWATEQYEVIAVEVQFEAPVINPKTKAASRTWRMGGKIDAVVRDDRGRVLLLEHKSSSEDIRPGGEYWRRLQLDTQISTYWAGAKALGHDVEGCIYDVLRKPGLRPYQISAKRSLPESPQEFMSRCVATIAEDPFGYYQRGEIVRLDSEVIEHQVDTWLTAKAMHEVQRLGVAPRNPDACMRYGRTCAFFDVCTGVGSLDDQTRFRKLDVIHEELGNGSSQE